MSKALLEKACKHYKSQRIVGNKIGKSAATVNLLLKGTYPKPEKILKTVSEVFADLNATEVECPYLGVIHADVCNRYKQWAEQDKIHKDRLYMQVKEHCENCIRSR